MGLKEQLKSDINEARKAKDSVKKSAIEAVLALILTKEKSGGNVVVDDTAVIECVLKEVKVQNDIVEIYKDKHPEMAKEAEAKLVVLKSYLPKQLTEEEVAVMLRQIIKGDAEILKAVQAGEGRAKGLINKQIMPKINGVFDRAKVNPIVEKVIAEKF